MSALSHDTLETASPEVKRYQRQKITAKLIALLLDLAGLALLAMLVGPRLQRVATGTGLTLEGVYRLGLSAETKKANAALTGLGRTRRVLLGDTLLEEFAPEEIEVVFAHEVGHHVYRHLPKMIVWSVI